MTSDTVRGPSPKRRRLNPSGASIAASLTSVALLVAAPSAAHAAGWTAGPSFGAPSTAFTNDFVLSPNGASTAAWYEPSGASRVTVQRAAPDGTLGAPLDLGAGGAPVLATSASNLTAVAWIGLAEPGAGDATVHLTLLDAGGAVARDTVLDTLTSDEASNLSVDVALDDAGNATAVWTVKDDGGDILLLADRVTPGGSRVGATTIGSAATDTGGAAALTSAAPVVAAAPGGTTWIGWRNADRAVDVWRWPAGAAAEVGPTTVSAEGDEAAMLGITASSAGAAIAWLVPSGGDTGTGDIHGTRLNASGTLVGAPFTATSAVDTSQSGGSLPGVATGPDVAIGPDGVVTLGWTKIGGGLGGGSAALSRFAPGQATAASTSLTTPGALGALAPALDAAADGSILATWIQVDAATSFSLVGTRIAPDGTVGAASAVTAPSAGGVGAISLPIGNPRADAAGGGVVGVNQLSLSTSGGGAGSYSFAFGTYRFDAVGPAVTVDVPASAVVLTPVIFRATVGENAPLSWDFGDGSSGRGLNVSHVYAGPGVYTVTARASDAAGNETVVTRQLSITPALVPDSGRRDPAPPAPAAAAALKVARALRSGARVTVSGTIARSASGTVAVVYAQRVGGAAITVKKTAKIAKGRWSTTLALPRLLTRGRAARAKGSVTVTFAGSATIGKATVKRTVAFARARRAARKKQRAAARNRG